MGQVLRYFPVAGQDNAPNGNKKNKKERRKRNHSAAK
jgi:hypothetical protein